MEFDPSIAGYCTSDESSFAYVSAHDRWPIILDGAIADVSETSFSLKDSDARAEGGKIIEGLQALKAEIQSDGELLWKGYDVFARQKKSTFQSSKTAILELATRYKTVLNTAAPNNSMVEAFHFKEVCEICLWGNATDLSLLTSLEYEDIQKLQGVEARKSQMKNVLINDISAVYDTLNKVRQDKGAGGRIDIILDNSGFELYVDLLLAAFLLSTGLASKVVLHPKSLPWFVSDVVPADFTDLLVAMSEPESFFGGDIKNRGQEETETVLNEQEKGDLETLCAQWKAFQNSGKLIVREDSIWTTAGSYWRLPHVAPSLFGELQESDLVIFKGDLNYRKLTGDVKWNPTTSFSEAIGPLGQGSGVRTLALRTCKADVVVGLAEGQDEGLRNA
ncbi:hypothetical protein AbraIFM66951_000399 [Aspergillus brasiliensis]|uniref:Sugar phosphate phosphatase n=1 Tax=Aspergillus brasiliensis TaxID=319629 RepID=A0A9W5YMC8_9EURO|nr:hypothetical protein AbraCBS73388_000386 [Aspergillus brasiliensis]GKZ42077.1 hypothetical protein AbraIFM66951_000399 [Aspergillus brasiliensis]